MDVVTELTARVCAYIGLLQNALSLLRPGSAMLPRSDGTADGPVLLGLNPDLLTEEQVGPDSLLWQKFYDYPRFLSAALNLVAPEKNMEAYKQKPGERIDPELEKELKVFARQARQLLVLFLLPHRQRLVASLSGISACGGQVVAHASSKMGKPFGPMAFLPPEPWRRAVRALLYAAPETRLVLVQVLGASPDQPYRPLLVQKAEEVIHENSFRKKATGRLHELIDAALYLIRAIRVTQQEIKIEDPGSHASLMEALALSEKTGMSLKHVNHESQKLELEEVRLFAEQVSALGSLQQQRDGNYEELRQLQEKISLIISLLAGGLTPGLQEELLLKDKVRDEVLNVGQSALPFEVVFRQELEEIRGRRRKSKAALAADEDDPDVLQEAARLQLCGLAFSGGGIRSATFNLGILQGLASRGWLPQIDYLSAVSGGNYLACWLSAWIKRAGTLRKVVDRLCPDISPEPRAEEVRPIRWLRMYSNYLAPNPSIMSTDSWTLGVTWLRNTILNQVIIVLALGAVMAAGAALLRGWQSLSWQAHPVLWQVLICVLLLGGALVAGFGMSMFRNNHRWPPKLQVQLLVITTVVLTLLGAFLVSGLLFNQPYPGFADGLINLWPFVPLGAVGLLLVAWLGRYDRCFFSADDERQERAARQLLAWVAIALTSIIAAAVGLCALVFAWRGLYMLHQAQGLALFTEMEQSAPLAYPQPSAAFSMVYLAFVIGLPLVLEVLAFTVVVRMALLGSSFPDERREWWGRMGAVIHLSAVVWLVLTGAILLSSPVLYMIQEYVAAKVVATGWVALVVSGIQFAHSARTQAQADKPGASNWLERISSLAPYAFALGLLLLTAAGINMLLEWLVLKLPQRGVVELALGLSAVLGLLALLLGWRVEVNEFSLHHFYRNRLARAYLGASRRRSERNNTANPFTSFDRRDDLKICSLRQHDPLATGESYDGPYLIVNTTLNATQVTDLAQQDRKAESFVFTPRYCGFDFVRVRAMNPKQPNFDFGYRPTRHYAYPEDNGPALGTAMTISGAATNPNRGYHSSPASAFLLALFNVRLGWWMGNPCRDTWQHAAPFFGLFYLLSELFGRSTTSNRFVNLSDGGHFDNMGLYELVRRRCRYIILGDGEEDQGFTCEGLANAIRRCRVDFGVEIKIDVTGITNRNDGYSHSHYAIGTIHYPDELPGDKPGYLLYFKSSLTDDEPTDVREYAKKNKAFPHQSTGDQFFSEPQFESYRRLGLHVVEKVLMTLQDGDDLHAAFEQLRPKEAQAAADLKPRPWPVLKMTPGSKFRQFQRFLFSSMHRS